MNPYLHSLTFYGLPLVQRTKPSFPKQFSGQKSPLLPANSFFVPQLVRRTEESISGQCNHQVPSTVNGTRKLGAGQDKEKTQKRHRKDTQKKRQAIFSATKPSLGYKRHPDERI